jgi:hypothetical protein
MVRNEQRKCQISRIDKDEQICINSTYFKKQITLSKSYKEKMDTSFDNLAFIKRKNAPLMIEFLKENMILDLTAPLTHSFSQDLEKRSFYKEVMLSNGLYPKDIKENENPQLFDQILERDYLKELNLDHFSKYFENLMKFIEEIIKMKMSYPNFCSFKPNIVDALKKFQMMSCFSFFTSSLSDATLTFFNTLQRNYELLGEVK